MKMIILMWMMASTCVSYAQTFINTTKAQGTANTTLTNFSLYDVLSTTGYAYLPNDNDRLLLGQATLRTDTTVARLRKSSYNFPESTSFHVYNNTTAFNDEISTTIVWDDLKSYNLSGHIGSRFSFSQPKGNQYGRLMLHTDSVDATSREYDLIYINTNVSSPAITKYKIFDGIQQIRFTEVDLWSEYIDETGIRTALMKGSSGGPLDYFLLDVRAENALKTELAIGTGYNMIPDDKMNRLLAVDFPDRFLTMLEPTNVSPGCYHQFESNSEIAYIHRDEQSGIYTIITRCTVTI